MFLVWSGLPPDLVAVVVGVPHVPGILEDSMSSDPLYFQDFLLKSQAAQCTWCGEVKGLEELWVIQEDVSRHAVLMCQECWEHVNWG